MSAIIWDIETGALSDEVIIANTPAFESKLVKPEPFDEAKVKVGNIKDADKIKAKIDDARQKSIDDLAQYEDEIIAEEKFYWQNVKDNASLNPLTSEILSIGYRIDGQNIFFHGMPEEIILMDFWQRIRAGELIGFNTKRFDLPFVIRRSWVHGVTVPSEYLLGYKSRWFPSNQIDLMEVYENIAGKRISLNDLAKQFGLGSKEHDGTYFATEYRAGRVDNALEYLANDLVLTEAVAKRMGVIK